MSHDRAVAVDPAQHRGKAFGRLTGVGGALAVAGVGASVALAGGTPQFYFSWLVAYLFFLSIALGGLFFVLVLAVSRAGWGVSLRRVVENVMATLPVFAVLFVPIWLGRHELYAWARPEEVAKSALLRGKAPFLNEDFWFVRAILYFVAWSALATFFSTQSQKQDETGDERISARMRGIAPVGIILFALSTTFCSIDWMMSLEPEWYSTMYGVYFFSGAVIAIFSFVILLVQFAYTQGALRGVVTTEHLHDVGKLLFGFTIFWAYIAFSQYFLIWYGNIPEETVYYMKRQVGSWQSVGMLLAYGHFLLPFFFLMPRAAKRSSALLVIAAVWQLFMHFLDLHWAIMPVLHPESARPGFVDLAAFSAVGGVFLAAIGWVSSRRALVPLGDPRLPEALSFENV
ncbi:MAG: quinol:cytochrome C oxidoreductase [Deltaproteobacteria bacterium]|nr:quinol:cytochrome C oxidoreductase [Deltaproteobacteria bacterium]